MTNNSPIESQSSSDDDLGFDDFIGILVAFLTIGTILFWSFSRKESNWNFDNFLSKARITSVCICLRGNRECILNVPKSAKVEVTMQC